VLGFFNEVIDRLPAAAGVSDLRDSVSRKLLGTGVK
jgi:hypothetical protein